jgi:hypothetical protein
MENVGVSVAIGRVEAENSPQLFRVVCMPATTTKRSIKFPSPRKKSRTLLDQQTTSSVDVFLKLLRKISRGSTATQASHTSETRILEQLLYKSRNQHHNALFWRNCIEIKRYSSRIEEASLSIIFGSIRASFYEDKSIHPNEWCVPSIFVTPHAKPNRKTAPWTHLPEERFLESVMERLQVQVQLYEQV